MSYLEVVYLTNNIHHINAVKSEYKHTKVRAELKGRVQEGSDAANTGNRVCLHIYLMLRYIYTYKYITINLTWNYIQIQPN